MNVLRCYAVDLNTSIFSNHSRRYSQRYCGFFKSFFIFKCRQGIFCQFFCGHPFARSSCHSQERWHTACCTRGEPINHSSYQANLPLLLVYSNYSWMVPMAKLLPPQHWDRNETQVIHLHLEFLSFFYVQVRGHCPGNIWAVGTRPLPEQQGFYFEVLEGVNGVLCTFL